jgi:hypothetical protein
MRRLLLTVFIFALAAPAWAQTRTTITDTLLNPDGSGAQGSVLITSPMAFTSADGFNVPAGVVAGPLQLSSGGGFSVSLIPNAGSTPTCSGTPCSTYVITYTYRIKTSTGGTTTVTQTQNWYVTSSILPLKIANVVTSVGSPSSMPVIASMATVAGGLTPTPSVCTGGMVSYGIMPSGNSLCTSVSGTFPFQAYNVLSYGATGNGSTDDRAGIQSAANAACTALGSGSVANKGAVLMFPPGIYLLNSTATDSYTTHGLLLDSCNHIQVIGFGATLVYAVNTAANVVEVRGTSNAMIQGLKIVSTNTAVGTGVNLIRPTSTYGNPTQKNLIANCEFSNLAVAIQNGNSDANQVSENAVRDTTINVPAGGKGVVQQGTSNFNETYENITYYGPSSASATMIDLINGTATFIRPTLETSGGNTGIKVESSYIGPADFNSIYAEVGTDTDQFLLFQAPAGYVNFNGGDISFFGGSGTCSSLSGNWCQTGAPVNQFDVQAGANITFNGTNIAGSAGGYKSFTINPSTPPAVQRNGGFWSSEIVFYGNTSMRGLPSFSGAAMNLTQVGFGCGPNIADNGSATSLTVWATPSCGGTPVPDFLFGNNYVQLQAGTFNPPSNGNGNFGNPSDTFGASWWATLTTTGVVTVGTLGSATSTAVCSNAGILSTCSSLRALKTNIRPLRGGLAEVMQMHPVSYTSKTSGKPEAHFLAEDVQALDPRCAAYDRGKLVGVNDGCLLAEAVRAIQELTTRLGEDEKQLARLKAAKAIH